MSETQATARAQPLPPGAADAMIARAAGAQIDEMLAKAEVERPATGADAGGANSDVVGDLNRLIDQGNETTTAAPAVEAPEEKPVENNNAAVEEKADAPATPSAASAPTSSDAPTPSMATAAASLDAPAAQPPPQPSPGVPGEGEKGAGSSASAHSEASHGAAVSAPAAAAAPESPQSGAMPEEQAVEEVDEPSESHEPSLPAWLKPLELLNQPFSFIPDSVRSALGKAAIVTLVNSMALLIYVFKFRNNHH